MLKIRLQRTGRENIPFYSVVLADHHSPVKRKFIEKLGTYNPLGKPWTLEVDVPKIESWIKKGAQPSSTMARLLKAKGVPGMEKFIVEMFTRKKKSEMAAAAEAAGKAPAPAAAKPAPAAASAEAKPADTPAA